jgi:heme exporter protein A
MPASTGAHPVEARDLRKTYGLLSVLRGIDLTVPAGQVVALLGANGAGKSTLLRCLAGTSRPTGGRLDVLGTELFPKRPPSAALGRIGLVAHDPLIYLDLTPRQNLAFFAQLYGAATGRVNEQIARFGLTRFADRGSRTLSRGTLQRLALARALLHEPRLLLLDEPFTGLDDAGQEVLVQTLAEAGANGVACVLVSHDLGRVAAVAHRVVILAGGRVAEDRTPSPTPAELASIYRASTTPAPPRDAEPIPQNGPEPLYVDDRR